MQKQNASTVQMLIITLISAIHLCGFHCRYHLLLKSSSFKTILNSDLKFKV